MVNDWLRDLYRRYFIFTDWNIGIAEMSPSSMEALILHGKLGRVRWCPRLSRLVSRADPFVLPLAGRPRVLYEEIGRLRRRGRIRSISLDEFSRLQRPRQAIDRPFHLSYPFVVSFESRWYCVPESARDGGLDLYAWDSPNDNWVLERRLIDGIGVLDATIFNYRGLWYLFGTVRGDGSYDKLRIWWSDSLKGTWRMHQNDPAKTDVRSARPAGPLFQFAGSWYRPAQDCTGGYGGAITINRVDALSPTEFRETTLSRVAPDPEGPYPHGLHTLTLFQDKALIDGKRTGFSALQPAIRLLRRLGREID